MSNIIQSSAKPMLWSISFLEVKQNFNDSGVLCIKQQLSTKTHFDYFSHGGIIKTGESFLSTQHL